LIRVTEQPDQQEEGAIKFAFRALSSLFRATDEVSSAQRVRALRVVQRALQRVRALPLLIRVADSPAIRKRLGPGPQITHAQITQIVSWPKGRGETRGCDRQFVFQTLSRLFRATDGVSGGRAVAEVDADVVPYSDPSPTMVALVASSFSNSAAVPNSCLTQKLQKVRLTPDWSSKLVPPNW